MSNRLKTLVAFIQAITGQTVEEVAKSINYTRVHLSKEMGKDSGNQGIEKILKEKYSKEMDDFFGDKEFLLAEDKPGYGSVKVIDFEERLVHDVLIVKGMLRVILRNQAAIIAGQEGVPVSSVLKKIAKAVRAETKEEFSEL